MQARILEVCVDDADGLAAAIAGGADRIELCSALGVGGLTPTRGFMQLAARSPIPVNAIIRPRIGGFVYSDDEAAIMIADIEAACEAGLAGVVVGASRSDGTLDRAVLERLIKAAATLDVTLHRAFDLVPDFDAAVEMAIDLGFADSDLRWRQACRGRPAGLAACRCGGTWAHFDHAGWRRAPRQCGGFPRHSRHF